MTKTCEDLGQPSAANPWKDFCACRDWLDPEIAEWLARHRIAKVNNSVVGDATKNSLEAAIRQTAQLIPKAIPTQGLVDGSVFPSPGGDHHPVDGTYPIAQSDAGVLHPAARLGSVVGVSFYDGEQVLVVGPWFMSFNQLSSHGYLSEDEVQQLLAAVHRIDRALYRVIRRKSLEARKRYEALHAARGSCSFI